MKWLDFILGCGHRHLTRPLTPVTKSGIRLPTRVTCLQCGAAFRYDFKAMRMGARLDAEDVNPVDIDALRALNQ
jgi:hypothetical protein